MVTSLRTGSTIVELMDLAAVAAPMLGNVADLAKGAGSLAEFAKFMFDSLQRKKQADLPTSDPLPGGMSADAVIEAASKIDGEIEVVETTAKEVTVRKIRVTTTEAIAIREREKTQRAEIRAAQALIEGPHAQRLLGGQQPRELADAIRRLSSTGASHMDVKAAIESFVSALHLLGLVGLVERIAVDFENAGEFQLAALLRGARERVG
ncbi:MAG: hypothetical protein JWP50_1944 [Phenylobacterium sp.]|nr:hypothetical protein [Phenylobacterium sp.]